MTRHNHNIYILVSVGTTHRNVIAMPVILDFVRPFLVHQILHGVHAEKFLEVGLDCDLIGHYAIEVLHFLK